MRVRDREELRGDDFAETTLVIEDPRQILDAPVEFVALGLELDA